MLLLVVVYVHISNYRGTQVMLTQRQEKYVCVLSHIDKKGRGLSLFSKIFAKKNPQKYSAIFELLLSFK